MQFSVLAVKLARNDVRLIGRDSMLIGVFFLLILIAFILRYGLPWLNTYLAQRGILPSVDIDHSLSDYYPLIIAVLVMFNGATIIGFIFGFVLLDEKDDDTLKAMMVTPVPFNQYVIFRVGAPMVLAFTSVFGTGLFINQVQVDWWQLALIAASGSLMAPITSLFLAVFAENKLQGFVYGKFISIASWIIILGWFVAEPWQWFLGVFPPFWICKAYWMAIEGQELWWLSLIVGIILQLGMTYLLVHRFNKIAHD